MAFLLAPESQHSFARSLRVLRNKGYSKPLAPRRPGVSGVWTLPWGNSSTAGACEVSGADVDSVRLAQGGS